MLRRHPPPVAGRYVLLEEVGHGGCGSVHRARDLRHRRYVAAKVARTPEHRARLARERDHGVTHPHVLRALGWATDGDLAVLTMELVTGGTLREHRRLEERAVAVLLGQLLDALDAVHAAGWVHGDVKPANLLLRAGPRPHLLLADFGVATPAGSGHGVEGTPAWLAPERAAGAAPRPAQDVYAAGLVARRAMARPGPLSTLCDSMTRADPRLRPSAAQALGRLRELCPWGPVL